MAKKAVSAPEMYPETRSRKERIIISIINPRSGEKEGLIMPDDWRKIWR